MWGKLAQHALWAWPERRLGKSCSLPPTASCRAPTVPLLTAAFLKSHSKSLALNTPQVLLDARCVPEPGPRMGHPAGNRRTWLLLSRAHSLVAPRWVFRVTSSIKRSSECEQRPPGKASWRQQFDLRPGHGPDPTHLDAPALYFFTRGSRGLTPRWAV